MAGSTRNKSMAKILRIDIGAARVTSQIDAIDAFGVGVGREASAARLYFARARTAEIWSVALDAGGNFSGAPMRKANLWAGAQRRRWAGAQDQL